MLHPRVHVNSAIGHRERFICQSPVWYSLIAGKDGEASPDQVVCRGDGVNPWMTSSSITVNKLAPDDTVKLRIPRSKPWVTKTVRSACVGYGSVSEKTSVLFEPSTLFSVLKPAATVLL
jgi:hypothetical protein